MQKHIGIRKKTQILFFLFLQTLTTYSQVQKQEKTIFQTIIGEKLETSIIFMPLGFHTKTPDIFGVWYTGYNYKGFEVSLFKNSYRDLTFGFSHKRVWRFTDKFSANYGVGILYGYEGRLQNVEGIPLRDSFLFNVKINPVIALEVDYEISKKLCIHSSLTPLVIIYGLRYRL